MTDNLTVCDLPVHNIETLTKMTPDERLAYAQNVRAACADESLLVTDEQLQSALYAIRFAREDQTTGGRARKGAAKASKKLEPLSLDDL